MGDLGFFKGKIGVLLLFGGQRAKDWPNGKFNFCGIKFIYFGISFGNKMILWVLLLYIYWTSLTN